MKVLFLVCALWMSTIYTMERDERQQLRAHSINQQQDDHWIAVRSYDGEILARYKASMAGTPQARLIEKAARASLEYKKRKAKLRARIERDARKLSPCCWMFCGATESEDEDDVDCSSCCMGR